MNSPFPGMDPYLESPAIRTDFHQRLATEISNNLSEILPPYYYASLESRIAYESSENGAIQLMVPDVAVQRTEPIMPVEPAIVSAIETTAVRDAPIEVVLEMDTPTKVFSLEIKTVDGNRVVTNIELLSPVNKQPGTEDYLAYLRKRRALLQSATHLLEIDLSRQGKRVQLAANLPQTPYMILLSRSERRPRAEVWPIPLTEPLPTIPVPLLKADPDVFLDLQTIITRIYNQARYWLRIDYRQKPPPPSLSRPEQAWLETQLAQFRQRSDRAKEK